MSTSNTLGTKFITVNVGQLRETIRAAEAAGDVSLFIMGQPGLGKTAEAVAYAKELGRECIVEMLGFKGPQDFGYPYLETNEDGSRSMQISRPNFWPKTDNPVIILDEFNQASKSVQNNAQQLIHAREVNGYKLPEKALVILLGNRPEDKVNVEKLSSACVNRVCIIRVEAHQPSWIKWAQSHGIDPLITSFIQFRPDLLTNFDGKKWDGASNFASPRTWEKASKIINATNDRHIRHAMLEGTLGQGAAAELVGFLGIYEKLPDLDQVLADPDKAEVPTDPSVVYATCAGLAKKVKPKTMENFCKYIDRLNKEFAVFAIKTAGYANKTVLATPAFTQWVTRNQDSFNKI